MSRVNGVWRLLNLPCEGMARLASESLDRDLEPVERIALGSHSLYCRACRRYGRQLHILRRALQRLASRIDNEPEDDLGLPGPGLPDEVRERIKRALEEP